jgi:DNA polymerase-3 subunit alpha
VAGIGSSFAATDHGDVFPPVPDRLREVPIAHPGSTEVQLQLRNGERTSRPPVAEGLGVASTPALMGDRKALLGPSRVAG